MPYNLICEQLSLANIDYDIETLRKTDIVEYMVLEAAGCLPSLQGTKLKAIFRPGFTSHFRFDDDKPRIEIGLKNIQMDSMNQHESQQEFVSKVSVIKLVFKESVFDDDHQNNNYESTFYSVILLDESIEKAIRSSSLYKAAGDLTQFDFYDLLKLKDQIGLYKIDDPQISQMVDTLTDKITTVMQNDFKEEFNIELAFSAKKNTFNQLLTKLELKINALISKGNIENKKYDETYYEVAAAAHGLLYSLKEARDKFFYTRLSDDSILEFEQACKQAIELAKTEFPKFRGGMAFYYDAYPILKGISMVCRAIVGILAGVTVFPALATAYWAPQGYLGTFFYTESDSSHELNSFEAGLPKFLAISM
ncbi:MAG: hypothetical protein H0U73_07695 [Tatlockia sp.]|nr:hypothetical protein [Tatlockia sp.]